MGIAALEGILAGVFELFLCCAGGRTPKGKVTKAELFIPFFSQSQCCQVDYCQDHAQGSGEYGAVSSLPAGFGQASGRVAILHGVKIEAAAASPGTSRFRLWNVETQRESGVLVGAHGLCRVVKLARFMKRWDMFMEIST